MIKVGICPYAAFCISFLCLWCSVCASHNPVPSWQETCFPGTQGLKGLSILQFLTINTKSYTVLVLMSLINHWARLDEPVISVWGINPHYWKLLTRCAQTGFAENTSWPFWCRQESGPLTLSCRPTHRALFNTLCFWAAGHHSLVLFSAYSSLLYFGLLVLTSYPLLSPPYHVHVSHSFPLLLFLSKRKLTSIVPLVTWVTAAFSQAVWPRAHNCPGCVVLPLIIHVKLSIPSLSVFPLVPISKHHYQSSGTWGTFIAPPCVRTVSNASHSALSFVTLSLTLPSTHYFWGHPCIDWTLTLLCPPSSH